MIMIKMILITSFIQIVVCQSIVRTNKEVPLVGKNKTLQFLDSIKRDLRRNNDDYLDLGSRNISTSINSGTATGRNHTAGAALVTSTAGLKYTNHEKQDKIFHNANVIESVVKDANRRHLDDAPPNHIKKHLRVSTIIEDNAQTDTTTKPPKLHKKLSHKKDSTFNSTPTALGYKDRTAESIEKSDKHKGVVENYKNLLHKFGSREFTKARTIVMKARLSSVEDTSGHVPLENDEQRPHRPPSPDRLDMAPAKGGKIDALRIKGRLCGRSVLTPEGPKYDSRGAVYLARVAGPYVTRPPPLVLPRCCNCCKKSVLGCQ